MAHSLTSIFRCIVTIGCPFPSLMADSLTSIFRCMAAMIVVLVVIPSLAVAQIYFDTHENSRLWMEGSSTVHRFDCVARSIQGTAFIDIKPSEETAAGIARENDNSLKTSNPSGRSSNRSTRQIDSGFSSENDSNTNAVDRTKMDTSPEGIMMEVQRSLHVLLKIPVKSFDCRHSRMNRDMYEALRSDKYDYITFEFEDAEQLENNGSVSESFFEDGYVPFRIQGVLNVAGVDRNVALLVQGRTEGEGRYRVKGRKEISMKDFEIEPPTALRGLIRAHDDLTVFFDLHVIERNSN